MEIKSLIVNDVRGAASLTTNSREASIVNIVPELDWSNWLVRSP